MGQWETGSGSPPTVSNGRFGSCNHRLCPPDPASPSVQFTPPGPPPSPDQGTGRGCREIKGIRGREADGHRCLRRERVQGKNKGKWERGIGAVSFRQQFTQASCQPPPPPHPPAHFLMWGRGKGGGPTGRPPLPTCRGGGGSISNPWPPVMHAHSTHTSIIPKCTTTRATAVHAWGKGSASGSRFSQPNIEV